MLYFLFGFWIRREACRLAAKSFSGAWAEHLPPGTTLWSLTVFFEQYLLTGADGTKDDFGPVEPIDLGIVRSSQLAAKD